MSSIAKILGACEALFNKLGIFIYFSLGGYQGALSFYSSNYSQEKSENHLCLFNLLNEPPNLISGDLLNNYSINSLASLSLT